MKTFTIRRGHNLKISGIPSKKIINVNVPDNVYFHPSSIKNIKVKLLVKVGDVVMIGSPLFYDKKNKEVMFVSSCSGKIEKIQFGPRRIVELIAINNDKKNIILDTLDNKINKENLLKSGLWTYLRHKPYSKIPHYSTNPKSIYITSMPTEPFALNYEYLMDNNKNCLQA